MSHLLRGELIKTVTTRTVLGFAVGGVVFAVLNVLVIAVASGTLDKVPEKEEALAGLPILLLLWGLVGAAGEYRHRTAAPAALVGRRDRGVVLSARIVAYALTGLLLGTLTTIVSVGLALPLLSDQPGPDLTSGDIGAVVAGNLVAFVLSAILGAALGALIRSPVLGVVVLLIVNFAVVPLLSGVSESGVNLTPFGAAGILSRMTHNTTLSMVGAGWVLAAWTVAITLVAVIVERRRDLA
ncbi:ABC transporter permease [Streptomyces beijiangensis]|uniref:ABC transporter permease n=1 Tax=Streptomyces beijiangensis TaxID=163361 RepID=A0A939JIN7_9ACTN|nr:ABC transporter permease [Streptomyces beijiangensis]MBO0512764.1 ABC transporter permease [Streptomyces beijiangensis]